MSREVRRVALDFEWPRNKVWEGYLIPPELGEEIKCSCDHGLGPEAETFHDQWYGNAPFDPYSTGSKPFRADGPEAMAWAERQCERSPEYYGSSDGDIRREAARIADYWNNAWLHHLSQEDVDELVHEERLVDFTHDWVAGQGWTPKEGGEYPTAEAVNLWSLQGMGHDSTNAYICIQARAEREGVLYLCPKCDGHGSIEAYPGQRKARDSWEPTEPPTGEGLQLWETVSEGSPLTEVFSSSYELAKQIILSPSLLGPSGHSFIDLEEAQNWVENSGWAPSGMFIGIEK